MLFCPAEVFYLSKVSCSPLKYYEVETFRSEEESQINKENKSHIFQYSQTVTLLLEEQD